MCLRIPAALSIHEACARGITSWSAERRRGTWYALAQYLISYLYMYHTYLYLIMSVFMTTVLRSCCAVNMSLDRKVLIADFDV